MAWTTQEYKAIQDYAKRYSYKLTLSTKPIVTFINSNNRYIKKKISDILIDYEVNKKEEVIERDRLKREEERKNRRYSWQ